MSALEFGLLRRIPAPDRQSVAALLRNLVSPQPIMPETSALCLAATLLRLSGLTHLALGDAELRIKATPAGPRRPTPPPPAPRPVPA